MRHARPVQPGVSSLTCDARSETMRTMASATGPPVRGVIVVMWLVFMCMAVGAVMRVGGGHAITSCTCRGTICGVRVRGMLAMGGTGVASMSSVSVLGCGCGSVGIGIVPNDSAPLCACGDAPLAT